LGGALMICAIKVSFDRANEKDFPYDDDERFYEETAYNEEYYIKRERELIRQSHLYLELEELEERHIREIRDEGLQSLRIEPGKSESVAEKESPLDQPEVEIPF
jgi:hypothetical protein